MSRHPMNITSATLADGGELIYFDDDPGVLSGQVTRELVDHRDLPESVTESEMRRDPLTGEWITYAAHRNSRTFMPPANENPLAPTTPGNLPTEIPADDYDVVVFENRFPSFSTRIAMPDDPTDYPWTVDGEELFPRRPAPRKTCLASSLMKYLFSETTNWRAHAQSFLGSSGLQPRQSQQSHPFHLPQ